MTEHTPEESSVLMPGDLEGISITAANIQAPSISIPSSTGESLFTIHPDGRLELGDDYQPEEAARAFWDAVQRLAPTPMVQQYGAPLTARINAELAAGEKAQKTVQAVTEAVILWRDRPGAADIGLALSLADILDTEQPEPPAATALVRVLRECDRIECAVRANPTSPDFDGAYLAAIH